MINSLLLTGATLVALVYLLVPGLTVLWGLGIHGALRVVAAPAVSLGMWAGATWIAIGLQLPWRAWLALPLLGLICLPFVVGRLWTLRPESRAVWPRVPSSGVSGGLWAVFAGCAVLSALPYLVSTRVATRIPQTWDVVFHLSGIRYTRELASASPWITLAPMNEGVGAYYPNIFHNLVALLPGSPLQAYVGAMTAVLVLWPALLGLFALLTLTAWKGAGAASRTIAALTALGTATSSTLTANYVANLATPPYTFSLLATPGMVIFAVAIYRLRPTPVKYPRHETTGTSPDTPGRAPSAPSTVRRLTQKVRENFRRNLLSSQLAPWMSLGWLVGLAGLGCTHPAAVFNLVLLMFVPVLVLGWRRWRSWQVSRGVKLFVPLSVAVLLGVGFWLALVPRLVSMSKFANSHNHTWDLTWRLLMDYPKGPFFVGFGLGGAIYTAAAVVASVWLVRQRRLLWLVGGLVMSVSFFLLAAGPVWPGYFLTAPWYLQSGRIAPLVLMCVYPLGALALSRGLERLVGWSRERARPRSYRWFSWALAAVVLLSGCGGTLGGRLTVIDGSYDPAVIVRGTMVTASEQAFIERVAPTLPRDAVIWGAPQIGTPFWWILGGVHVARPALNYPTGRALAVTKDLYDGQISAETCDYLKAQGVTHYYSDNDAQAAGSRYGIYIWFWNEPNAIFRPPSQMLQKIAENTVGTRSGEFTGQRLYRVNYDTCPGHVR